MCADARPVLLSTGMSSYAEIDAAVAAIKREGAPLAVMQCASRYPTPLEAVGLNVIDDYRQRYGCPVGLSDHSGRVHPALAALAQGADIIEVHLTLSRHMFGPDVPVSLTVAELRSVAAARDAFHTMASHPCLKFAAKQGATQCTERLSCLFPPSDVDLQDILTRNDFRFEASDFIVMTVHCAHP